MIILGVFPKEPLPLTMTLNLHCGRLWLILCPPSDVLRNIHNGCIPIAVHKLFPELTYPHCYNILTLVKLLQITKVLSGMVARARVLT